MTSLSTCASVFFVALLLPQGAEACPNDCSVCYNARRGACMKGAKVSTEAKCDSKGFVWCGGSSTTEEATPEPTPDPKAACQGSFSSDCSGCQTSDCCNGRHVQVALWGGNNCGWSGTECTTSTQICTLAPCTWNMINKDQYCKGKKDSVKKLSEAGTSTEQCKDMASADAACSNTIVSNGAKCRCVVAGQSCNLKNSDSGNSVYECSQAPAAPAPTPPFVTECKDTNPHCSTYVQYYGRYCKDTPATQWFVGKDGQYGCKKSCGLC